MTLPRLRRALALCSILALSACNGGELSGMVRALSSGGPDDPPIVRVAPDEALVAACGAGEATAAGAAVMRRMPYLQQVASDRASILWTSTASSPHVVRLWDPAQPNEVRTLRSEIEETRVLRDARQHVARVDGLEPDHAYCYEIRDAGGAAMVAPTGLHTAPATGGDAPVRFLAFGDSGGGSPDQHALRDQMRRVPYDLALIAGDVAYTSGTLGQLEANYFDVYQPILRSVPFYPTTGNHDYETQDAAPFREVFSLPENGGEEGRERWYSFDWGQVHFAVLDTEQNGAAQAAWLERDLAGTEQPWIVVLAHAGPYSSGGHGSSAEFRELYGPSIERHRVALVISGHDHHYERMAPQNGVMYVVTGGGGKSTRILDATIPESAFSESVVHFVHGTVEGDEMRVRAVDATGIVFDAFSIQRRR